jgi:hypothetical protein
MTMRVDPRAWNLLAGLSLIAGACSGRIIGSDDGDDSSTDGSSSDGTNESSSSDDSTTSTSTSSTDESDTGDPECIQDSDCPPGYYCLDGICEYQVAPDGNWNQYECYSPYDCGPLELCIDDYCSPVLELSGCRPTAELGIPLTIAQTPLALSFVDLDADGAAELVVATQTELHAFESGSDVASVSARVVESPNITAMVAGNFAPSPGQDLTLLVDDTLLVHPADGIAGFDAPSESASPQLDSLGLIAGEFGGDGEGDTELMVWSENGANFSHIEAPLDGPILAMTAHDWNASAPHFMTRNTDSLRYYSIYTEFLTGAPSYLGAAAFLTAIAYPYSFDLNATVFEGGAENSWTLFELWHGDVLEGEWGMNGVISATASGELDSDSSDEVALIHDGGVTLIDNVTSGSECTTALDLGGLTGATHLAIGDHDGDGDSELAVAFAGGEILVFDGEG